MGASEVPISRAIILLLIRFQLGVRLFVHCPNERPSTHTTALDIILQRVDGIRELPAAKLGQW